MARTAEFVLGLIGGIFGFGTGFVGFVISSLDKAFSGSGLGSSVAWIFILSITGIIGSVVVKSRPKLGGCIMLVSGLGIIISSSLFGLLPSVLLIIAGLTGLIKKDKKQGERK